MLISSIVIALSFKEFTTLSSNGVNSVAFIGFASLFIDLKLEVFSLKSLEDFNESEGIFIEALPNNS